MLKYIPEEIIGNKRIISKEFPTTLPKILRHSLFINHLTTLIKVMLLVELGELKQIFFDKNCKIV